MDINIQTIITAAEDGGKIVKGYFGKTLDIEEKSTIGDFRTKADLESEKAVLQLISKQFPRFNILSEEMGLIDNKSEYTFVVDPLDGSNNFVLGIPNFSISIGLLKKNKAIAGVIYLPMLNHTYYAQEGQGSFLDRKRLNVNKESDIKKATVSYTCGYVNPTGYAESLRHKLNKLNIKRMLEHWSPAVDYCLLASGKLEAIINNKNEIYDYAAGKIIAREAGALITTFDGKPEEDDRNNTFLASNGTKIHKQLLKIV